MKENKILKLSILGFFVATIIICTSVSLKYYLDYRKLLNEYNNLESKILEPVNISNGLVTSSDEIAEILRNIPQCDMLITEIASKDGSVNIIRKLEIEELDNIDTGAIEITIACKSNGEMYSILKYLSNYKLGYEYISLASNNLDLRILVKGR